MLDTVGLQKIEERNKQFSIEKLIEFKLNLKIFTKQILKINQKFY